MKNRYLELVSIWQISQSLGHLVLISRKMVPLSRISISQIYCFLKPDFGSLTKFCLLSWTLPQVCSIAALVGPNWYLFLENSDLGLKFELLFHWFSNGKIRILFMAENSNVIEIFLKKHLFAFLKNICLLWRLNKLKFF